MPNKKKSRLKIVVNVAILFIVLFLVFYFTFKDNYQEIINTLGSLNPIWLIVSLLVMGLYYLFLTLSFHKVITSNNQTYSFKDTFKLILITQFFNGITPFSSGGQPAQVYYLKQGNIPVSISTNIISQNFIGYQVALIILGIFAIVFNKITNVFYDVSLVKNMVMIGFIINFLVMIGLFLISFGKKFNKFVVNNLITFFAKIKIIKKEEQTRDKVCGYLNSFYDNALDLSKNKTDFIKIIIYNILALVTLYSIVYFISLGLGTSSLTFVNSLVASAYVLIVGSFVPLPGGSGGIEYSFVHFFGYFFDKSPVMVLLLIWRFMTYYLGIIVGALTLLIAKRRDHL